MHVLLEEFKVPGVSIAVVPSQQVVVVLANDKRVDGQKPTPGDVRNELFELIFSAKKSP